MEDEKMIAFLRLMKDAFWYAEKAQKCSDDKPYINQNEDKLSALSYAAACTAKYSAAEAIYWTFPESEQSEIPELFSRFDTFVRSLQKEYEKKQIHFDSSFAFENLEKSFISFIRNQKTEL